MAAQLAPARVAVVGGGYAGLAAAVELADAGIDVTVFESSRTLGGRARRVDMDGKAIDNGQHLMVGAYVETLRLMEKVGVTLATHTRRQRLHLEFSDGFALRAPALPAPLHLAGALLRAPLTWGERAAAAKFMHHLKQHRFRLDRDSSVAALLAQQAQPDSLRRHLWEPLCLAALNTPIEHASAQVFANVLRDSLAGPRAASDLLHPAVDLSAMFPDPAATFIVARGGKLHCNEVVESIRRSNDRFQIATPAQMNEFTHVVVAVAPYHLAPLLQAFPETQALTRQVDALRYEPIATAYFAYGAEARLVAPMLGQTEGYAQWLFDRGRIANQPGLIAAVISAGGPWQALDRSALLQAIQNEIEPNLITSTPLHWTQLIVERRATFACTPNMTRPSTQTPVSGLLLAGDYVASDYPATLEAAVRSGVAAARSIIAQRVDQASA